MECAKTFHTLIIFEVSLVFPVVLDINEMEVTATMCFDVMQ